MKKFTSIRESYDLGAFTISSKEFDRYKNSINFLLKRLYIDHMIKVDYLNLIKALPYEKRFGREYSVLNKVNTNVVLLKKFVRMSNAKNIEELISFLYDNSEDFFKPDGKYFIEIYETIRNTERKGEENEEFVVDYIKDIIKRKYNLDIIPKREETSTYRDLILGIDVSFVLNGKEYTCQVKPADSYKIYDDHVVIESKGRLKQYNTNYIAFSNKQKGILLLFKNKDIDINGNTIKIDKKYLVQE